MFFLPLNDFHEKLEAGGLVGLVGPEALEELGDAEVWRPGQMVPSGRFELFLAKGPGRLTAKVVAPSWTVVVPLSSGVELDLAHLPGATNPGRGDFVVLAPGAVTMVTLSSTASCLFVVAPPCSGEMIQKVETDLTSARGRGWIIQWSEIEPALNPRDKVKIVEGNLWRPSTPPGLWHPGTEILSEEFALGVFRTGSAETAHLHERSWELYHVLEGELTLNVRPHRLGAWEFCRLRESQCLVLPPGAAHMVDQKAHHVSLVLQVPPAITDRETVSYTSREPSLKLPFYD